MSMATHGSLLSMEEGEYSDYQVKGFFVVLSDFSPHELMEEYRAQSEDSSYRDHDGFAAYLIRRGLLLEIQYGVLHIGNYYGFDGFRFTPVSKNQ